MFLYNCSVTVKEPEKRKQLIKWLKSIGRFYCYIYDSCDKVVANKYNCLVYFCENDIELFKSISSINDENDLNQWFVVKKDIHDYYNSDEIVYKKGDMFFNDCKQNKLPRNKFRKATAEEIMEYFKNRKNYDQHKSEKIS